MVRGHSCIFKISTLYRDEVGSKYSWNRMEPVSIWWAEGTKAAQGRTEARAGTQPAFMRSNAWRGKPVLLLHEPLGELPFPFVSFSPSFNCHLHILLCSTLASLDYPLYESSEALKLAGAEHLESHSEWEVALLFYSKLPQIQSSWICICCIFDSPGAHYQSHNQS